VLVKVEYSGICGSDLHAYKQAKGYEFVQSPRILGHELSGTVVETYKEEHKNLIHERVVAEAIYFCGECENCKNNRANICTSFQVMGLHFDGGMAEYVKCKAALLQKIPTQVPSVLAALTEPMSVAIHAVEIIGKVKKGDYVWVQGSGIIGFLVGLVCKNIGAKVIISGLPQDKEHRLVHAPLFGMIPHVESESPLLKDKVDVVFECSGSAKGVNSGIERVKKGGKLVFVALYEKDINMPLNIAIRNELNLLTTYSCKSDEYGRALEIINRYQKELLEIISVYALDRAEDAFNDALAQKNLKPILKIIS
jgi:L-iditol 2-dehydrogenase